MCTVSWLRQADGYLLLCNRDERNTRKPAAGPRIAAQNGISFIAPVDGDRGGSWIGVNQFGLTLCLLNRYGDPQFAAAGTFTSRGLLLAELLDCKRSQQVYGRVGATDLEQFQPFTMAILTVGEPVLLIDWTGRECLVQPDADSRVPLTSSSLKEPKIGELRNEQFRRMVTQAGNLNAKLLEQFHRSHSPERGPYSVCMHREDAATVSMSMVAVTPKTIEFVYYGGAPCLAAPVEKVLLERDTVGEFDVR
jgi:hypothetical protein